MCRIQVLTLLSLVLEPLILETVAHFIQTTGQVLI
jgi:hypothetical protein